MWGLAWVIRYILRFRKLIRTSCLRDRLMLIVVMFRLIIYKILRRWVSMMTLSHLIISNRKLEILIREREVLNIYCKSQKILIWEVPMISM